MQVFNPNNESSIKKKNDQSPRLKYKSSSVSKNLQSRHFPWKSKIKSMNPLSIWAIFLPCEQWTAIFFFQYVILDARCLIMMLSGDIKSLDFVYLFKCNHRPLIRDHKLDEHEAN